MKKKIYFVLFFVILFSLTLSASLLDVYKSGKIKLVPDSNFGKGTEWDIYFPQGIKDIAFLPDGSFFATGLGNKACHCVYKFNKKGKFIKKFGRKGKGPGDLYHPGALSILDNKYLLVADYPLNMKISVFDLNGNFVKEVRTKEYVFGLVALKGDYIAYLSWKSRRIKGNRYLRKYPVYVKNIKTGKEKLIVEFKNIEGFIPVGFCGYEVFIASTAKNNLLVSYSKESTVKIFSPEGKLIKEFKIDIPEIKVTKDIKRAYFSKTLIYGTRRDKERSRKLIVFSDYMEGYENVLVDEEGNILVFYNNRLYRKNFLRFRVYSRDGKYLFDSKIDTGGFISSWGETRRFKLYIFKDAIYSPVEKGERYEMIKVRIK